MSSNPDSRVPSRLSTPNPPSSRFTAQAITAEDLLKSQTVGLVHLSDFRKRRVEAIEQKEREAQSSAFGRFTPGTSSGAVTPLDGVSTPQPLKKRRKNVSKGKLSFGLDDEENQESSTAETPGTRTLGTLVLRTGSSALETGSLAEKKRIGANASLSAAPRVMTKSALLREAQTREQLRKEFLSIQEAVKAAEILIPFVFYDGTNIPGGRCKVKKGDHTWVFLDRSRKVGAELGVGGGEKASSRREWARVGVDDLMLVRGEVIIPHHYDFYHFIVNKTLGPNSVPLFDFSVKPTAQVSSQLSSPEPSSYDPLSHPSQDGRLVTSQDAGLEGYNDDPNLTKVVDRRWYERNKHIFPASMWEEYDPGKDYSRGIKKDVEGNTFFFS